MTRFPRHGSVV